MKFLEGDWNPKDSESPEPKVASDSLAGGPSADLASVAPVGLTPPAPAALAIPLTESQRTARDQLATFLNVQLSLVSGFWLGVVPASLIGNGSAVGGLSGGLLFTVMLATSSQLFLSNHPTFPYSAYLKSYGWEIVRRRDGKKRYLILLKPSGEDLKLIEAYAQETDAERKLKADQRSEVSLGRKKKGSSKKERRKELQDRIDRFASDS